jgi:hypothetical protein
LDVMIPVLVAQDANTRSAAEWRRRIRVSLFA